MKPYLNTVLLAGALLGASACAVHTHSTAINPELARGPTCQNAVEIYTSRADVPSDYRELAWIDAKGNSVWTTDAQMRGEMQKRAAEDGANGLIANPVDQNKTGVNIIGEAVGAHTATAKSSGLAIWIPGRSARTRQLCGT